MARAAKNASDGLEELPEADRLEGFLHPRFTEVLVGHAEAEAALAAGLARGQIPHAWLLTGRDGIGKATFAYRFARAALARPHDRASSTGILDSAWEASASRQIRALSHPGLLVIRRPYDLKTKRFATSIPVEDVRRLRGFLSYAADPGTWRVVIVDSADELNVNAANALLKSLEEPPPHTVFLLVSSEPARLLPTIRSRCRVLPMAALKPEDLTRAIRAAYVNQGKDAPDAVGDPRLIALSGGSVRRALSLLAADGLAVHATIEGIFAGLPNIDWRKAHALSDELQPAAAEQKFDLFYELFQSELARRVRAASQSGTSGGIISGPRLATFAALWERVARDKAQALALNLDRKSLILETFLALEAAAKG